MTQNLTSTSAASHTEKRDTKCLKRNHQICYRAFANEFVSFARWLRYRAGAMCYSAATMSSDDCSDFRTLALLQSRRFELTLQQRCLVMIAATVAIL